VGGRDRTDVVEAVRAQADLRAIVSDYLPLKKSSGSKYRALCPFHAEKTPSFYVDADKQLFYCFGCGTGGDVFKFLMLYEKLEFPEALKSLAARYGIPMPERSAPESSERHRILAINRRSQSYFRDQLQRPEGDKGRRYLEGRGISKETMARFQIGCAPDSWGGLKECLAAAGVPEEQAVLAGLLARKEETGRTYDRFRDRVVFPIVNLADETIGFGGRVIGAGEPKYLNSPATPLFDKSRTLYPIDKAKGPIRKSGQAVIVEGYTDALIAHQAGFENVVASLGTALTPGQVVRSSADMKWPAPSLATRAALRIDL